MLTRWTLENFKPIRARLDLPVAPLTVLAGLNSSGKSSFLQSILLVAQTLANQKLDEPLVLNGSLVRFGTFQDVCNDRAAEQKIRIGFSLDGASGSTSAQGQNGKSWSPARREELPATSVDVQFEGIRGTEDDAGGIVATRAILDGVEMSVVIAGTIVRVDVRRASLEDAAAFTSGIAGIASQEMPYPLGLNYVAEVETHDFSEVREKALVGAAHFIPRRYMVRRKSRVANLRSWMTQLIGKRDGGPPSASVVRKTLARMMSQSGTTGASDLLTDGARREVDKIATDHALPPFTGVSSSDLAAWLSQLPAALASDQRFGAQLMDAISPTDPAELSDVLLEGLLLDAFAPLERASQHIIDTFSSAIRYLGPLRAEPHAIQSFSPSGQADDVGPRGEYAAAVYASNRKQRIRFVHPTSQTIETATLEQAMDTWLQYLGIADHVAAREAAAPGVSWIVRSTPATRERPLGAVGVGVSQVLPILVAGLLAPEGTILIMEQPELHLHERPQARLGDFFYGLTRVGKQIFIETHSAVLIGQLRQRMVQSGQEARDAIAIYFVSQDAQGDAKFEPIRISRRGAVENWPDGFFDESFRQEDRITEEGMRNQTKRANA